MTYYSPTAGDQFFFQSGAWKNVQPPTGPYHYYVNGPDGSGNWHIDRNDQGPATHPAGCYYNPTTGELNTGMSWTASDPLYLSSTSTPGTSSSLMTTAGSHVYGFDSNNNLLFHFQMVAGGGSAASPTVNWNNNRTDGRWIQAGITNAGIAKTYYLVDANVINNGQFTELDSGYFPANSTSNLDWTAPSNYLSGTRIYTVTDSLTQTSAISIGSQSIGNLKPDWTQSSWTLTGSTLEVNISAGLCWNANDVISIRDSQNNLIGTAHPVAANYNGPWGTHYSNTPITLSGTINLNQTETYDVFIKDNNANTSESKRLSWTSADSYAHTGQYNISNDVWSATVANQVRVTYTQNNRNNAEVVELWKSNGSSAVSTDTTGGSLLTYNMTSTADNGTYLLKVGNTTWSTSNITYSYQAPAHNIVINPPPHTTTWTDDLNSGGTTVSATVKATNNGTSDGYIYLWETGNNTHVDSWLVQAHPSSTYSQVMSYTSASANTVYYLTIEGSNTTVLSHTTGSAQYAFTFGSWDTSVTNQVRATFSQSNPTGSETVTLNHPTDSSKNVTVNHLATEVTFTMTGTADDGSYSIGAEQQNYSYSAPAPPAPPATNTTPSGGGIKRYPMVLTQLFNKKRSFYSIGMTHKDGQLQCFL